MTYITSIGLDVHARSVSACAFDPFTGEVAQRRSGADAGEIAEWIPGFESPKAVYESGPTGFALCRELRAPGVDCVVGAVSKMQKPSAEKRRKNDRRDAAFLARPLATRNITEVWVPPVEAEAARDLSRALDDAREDLRRARRRLSKFLLRRGPVFDETDALGRRRGAWTRAFWRWAESCRPSDPAAAAAFDRYVACCAAPSQASAPWRRGCSPRPAPTGGGARSRRSRASRASTPSRRSAWPPRRGAPPGSPPPAPTPPGSASRPPSTRAARRRPKAASPRPGTPPPGAPSSRRRGTSSRARRSPRRRRPARPCRRPLKRRCDDAAARLRRRRESLGAAGKRPCVANVAVARELACWVWEVGRRAEGTLA